ncbi:hypothetical protein JMN32_02090 [Fulvivirga sp. 29W222]|uniref:Uncharacterized protein n=1 Tax=Fulvivirga marina TaxID=2494733 RepID=A0A937FT70_9BACT|nr:hypothetical protein [Fulvivirga marina]MBL6445079.1 hypothetical protein [Fulvivirga marina]
MLRPIIILVTLCAISFPGFTQEGGPKCKWVKNFGQPLSLDSLSIVPNTLKIQHGDSSAFSVEQNITKGEVIINTQLQLDSVLICYEVFPFSFHQQYYHRSLEIYDSNAYFKDPVKQEDQLLKREELFAIEGLNKSGSISRGISFGNNQDVFVNSTLNLNLEGKLTDDLNIRAAITDQNVPFQPEGNTQQLQDFDNVFIQVYNDNFSITGGDVVLKNKPSYFMRYYKNVQGGLAEVKYNLTDSISATTSLGVSVAKGKFASVLVPALEGVLGPYRIPGPDNESFVIILANSERVFLDGRRLERGFNNDYVIDYNSGEITFTNQVLITQFSRIRIDYEYSDQNYSRSITAASHYQQMGKLELFVNAYSEKDNRNRPLLLDLTNEDKILLSNVGDELQQAVISSADSVEYSNELILYEKTDTTDLDGALKEVYRYSTDPGVAMYKVTFSNVGLGNGNYVQAQTTANGRVFEWVSPVSGVPQGQYEPVVKIPAPNKKQLVNIGAEYKVGKFEKIFAEVAFSDQDVNLFSELDSKDDKGFAIKSGIASEGRPISFLPEYKWSLYSDFEFDERYFNPIDRFRYIEYDRDWGYDPATDRRRAADRIVNAGVGMRKNADNGVAYDISYRNRPGQVDGFQHRAKFDKSVGKFFLKTSMFRLDTRQDSLTETWTRYSADVSYRSKWVIPGYVRQVDKNRVEAQPADSVVRSAMYFEEHTFYLKSGKGSPVDFDIRHSIREDKRPLEGIMAEYSNSNTSRLTASTDLGKHKIKVLFTYRNLENLFLDEDEETVSGRLDWQSTWLDRHVRSDLTYTISNSREPKREFVYIKVPPGEGTHTWRDLNEDGIQDLNEFFEAINPDERNYAKIFIPTNEFVTAFQNLFIYRISLEMPRAWRKEAGLKKFLSSFSNNTSWSADVKTTDSNLDTRLFAFAKGSGEEKLLSEKNILRSTLFYNRTSPKYGAEVGYFNSGLRQLLQGGFESRDIEEYTLGVRVNLSRVYSLNIKTSAATKAVNSDFLEGRNYLIDSRKINPEIAWQPKGNIRISAQYGYESKENNYTSESVESAYLNEYILDVKLNKAVRSTFNARLRYVEIDFQGEENSPIGYDLLNALRPGENISWGVNWQRKITSGLQLNLSYDGRKSENVDVIHIGRVQVSALF